MRLYTVQFRPGMGDVTAPDVVLIKEGFCWPALFVPLLWLLYRLQFWGLAAYLMATGLLSVLVTLTGMDTLSGLSLSVVLSLMVGAVANDWRRWRLGAKGYELVTVVAASDLSYAEEIYFRHEWRQENQGGTSVVKSTMPPVTTPVRPMPASRLTPFATPFGPV